MLAQLNQTNTPSSQDNKTGTHVISLLNELKYLNNHTAQQIVLVLW